MTAQLRILYNKILKELDWLRKRINWLSSQGVGGDGIPLAQKGQPNGVAPLNNEGIIDVEYIDSETIVEEVLNTDTIQDAVEGANEAATNANEATEAANNAAAIANAAKGWTPVFVAENDGDRIVHQLSDYIGGTGDKPTANVGLYFKSDGTFTANIADAADYRGIAGFTAVSISQAAYEALSTPEKNNGNIYLTPLP